MFVFAFKSFRLHVLGELWKLLWLSSSTWKWYKSTKGTALKCQCGADLFEYKAQKQTQRDALSWGAKKDNHAAIPKKHRVVFNHKDYTNLFFFLGKHDFYCTLKFMTEPYHYYHYVNKKHFRPKSKKMYLQKSDLYNFMYFLNFLLHSVHLSLKEYQM